MQTDGKVVQVNLDDIIPNRFQPRIAFDEKGLNELASSIKEHGIIQPLVLRKLGNKYEIIAGERRYKAATLAGLTTVPAIISNIDDNASAEVALVENIQRRDLTPIEEARSYKNLLDKGYLTQEQLAKKMGLSQSAISNKLRLLNLDNKVQQALLDGKISERHARALLTLDNKEEQVKWLDRIIKERLTVRDLDQKLKEASGGDNSDAGVPLVDLTPNIEEMKENATDINNNKPKDISDLMIPNNNIETLNNNEIETLDAPAAPSTPNVETLFTPQEQVSSNVETLVSDKPSEDVVNNIADPFANIMNESQPLPENNGNTSNRFFNQLEEEPANLENLNPFATDGIFNPDDLSSTQNNEVQPQNTNLEIFDVAPKQDDVEPQFETPVADINLEPQSNTFNELNPNNKFFQPIVEEQLPQYESNVETQEETINPMNFIDNLDVPTQETVVDNSLNDAISDIRNLVSNLNAKGIKVKIDEADLDANYQINITIEK